MSGRSRATALVLALSALALGAGACGGDGASSPVSGEEAPAGDGPVAAEARFDRDACELLGDGDVEAILGEVVEGEATPGDPEISAPAQCLWSTGEEVDPANLGSRPSAVSVFVGDEQTYASAWHIAQGGVDYTELEIADGAYAGNGEGGVLIGAVGITVTPIGVDINDPGTAGVIADVLERVAANY